MQTQFIKLVQFSILIKVDERLREFNFRKINNTAEDTLNVNVCNERGERIFFKMKKMENGWEFSPSNLPIWIDQNRKFIGQAVEDELLNW